MTTQGHTGDLPQYVTRLGHYPVVLGIPWLRHNDVTIRFATDELTFGPVHCPNCQCAGQAPPQPELFGASCGPRPTGDGLAMDGPTSTVGPGQLWILTSADGPPFLDMHKGHIFGSIKLANVLGIKLLLCL